MHWKRPAVAISGAALLTLAACGGGSSGGGTGAGPTATFSAGGGSGQSIDMSRSDGPAPPIDGAKQGGTVTSLTNRGASTFDPTEIYYTNTASIGQALVFRSLTQYVYNPDTKEMVLIPDLASSWKSNADFTDWTFTLRDGVKYENGQPVTCADMRYGLLRSMDRDAFPTGASYSNDYFLGGDKYKGPITSGSTKFPGITCNGQDLNIKMTKPFPDMPYWGSFPAMSPIPQSASDPKKYRLHPLATGPYKFDKYQPGTSLTLVRNDQWDPASDPGRHAYPDGYNFKFTEDSSKLDQLIINDQGSAQTTLTYENLLTADYRTATQQAPDRVVTGTSPCTFFWYPDYTKITDVNVRRAIGLAYPYENAWLAAGSIVGVTRIPATSIMPPGIPGRPNKTYDPLGIGGKNTDTAKAKQMLKDANALGYELKFYYSTDDPNSVNVKNEIVKSLTTAGFKASPVATTTNQFYTLTQDPNSPVNVRSLGWCSDWPSGSSWLPPELGSNSPQSINLSKFSEPAVDKEMNRIQTLPLDQQPDAWYQLDKTIGEKYFPMIPTGYSGSAMMHGSKIQGMNNDSTFGYPTWKDIWISS